MTAPEVAFDRDGRAYLIDEEGVRPFEPRKHPLAGREGLAVLKAMSACDLVWSALTVLERRALDAEAGPARPMAALRAVRLLAADGHRTGGGEVLVRWARGAGKLPPFEGDAA